uniref:Uncharacterized protein n=1 Tax=Siphoviridae sp. ct4Rk11 TaxID=2825330 RepID=A0A8S5PTF9_9CAUD|nr:MAG TPA: hypothetical protein [Siphoviridae sp. ct4Rk11]
MMMLTQRLPVRPIPELCRLNYDRFCKVCWRMKLLPVSVLCKFSDSIYCFLLHN